MINGNLDQFLDTGWYSEATLYFHGLTYWCEAQWNDDGVAHFFVYSYPALNVNNKYCLSIIEDDGLCKKDTVFEMFHSDIEYIKKIFLEAEIFDGYRFWKVEPELAWLDDEGNIFRQDIPEYLKAVKENNKEKIHLIEDRYQSEK